MEGVKADNKGWLQGVVTQGDSERTIAWILRQKCFTGGRLIEKALHGEVTGKRTLGNE